MSRCTTMYFHAESEILLDSVFGVSRYDAEFNTFIPLKRMSKQEQRLFACLVAYDNITVTRDVILSEVWSGRVVNDNTINVAISRLRSKLRCIDPHTGCLKSVRNSGFIFSTSYTGLISIMSLDFLLSSLNWSKNIQV